MDLNSIRRYRLSNKILKTRPSKTLKGPLKTNRYKKVENKMTENLYIK